MSAGIKPVLGEARVRILMTVLVNFHQTDLPTFLLPTVLHRAHHLSLNLFSSHLVRGMLISL